MEIKMARAKAPSEYPEEYRQILIHFCDSSSPLEVDFGTRMSAEDLRQDLYRYFRALPRFTSNTFYPSSLRDEWTRFSLVIPYLRMSIVTSDPSDMRGPCKLIISHNDTSRAILSALKRIGAS
jgi:hypothetical protein